MPFISGGALEAIVHITNKYYLTQEAKHAVFEQVHHDSDHDHYVVILSWLQILSEMREITGRESLLREQQIEFSDFLLICNHFAIDHIFTEEVRTG